MDFPDSAPYVIAYADKTVLKISGVRVKGLDTRSLEELLMKKLNSVVRVIGVTGSSVDMDVYGIDPEKLLKDEQGIIEAVSLSEGITATEVARIAEAKRIVEVDYAELEGKKRTACARERWAGHD
ncbi:MAG: hypothetical protein VB085_10845 [Peptococcaceae bacterium]|nr:hypothetical protein [Peptococcaceae bacterium]